MDSGTGNLYHVADEAEAKKQGLIPVRRDLTAKERSEMQIRLYQPCGCGSGKKFKFCCKTAARTASMSVHMQIFWGAWAFIACCVVCLILAIKKLR